MATEDECKLLEVMRRDEYHWRSQLMVQKAGVPDYEEVKKKPKRRRVYSHDGAKFTLEEIPG